MNVQAPVKRWYVIHTQTGHEDRVKTTLEARAQQFNLKEKISQVLIPMEKVSEIKAGKKKISTRKFFPGYVLVEMEMNDETWYLIKNTPGVSGFIGTGRKPSPLKEAEVNSIIKQAEEKKEKPTPKVVFEKGESVRVKEGPFVNFNGTICQIIATGKACIPSVEIFQSHGFSFDRVVPATKVDLTLPQKEIMEAKMEEKMSH